VVGIVIQGILIQSPPEEAVLDFGGDTVRLDGERENSVIAADIVLALVLALRGGLVRFLVDKSPQSAIHHESPFATPGYERPCAAPAVPHVAFIEPYMVM